MAESDKTPRTAGPLTDDECQLLAQAWVRYKRGSIDDRPAWNTLVLLTATDPETAWRVTLCLIDMTRDTELLSAVGAGPLEELVAESSARFIDRAEKRASEDPSFKAALSSVWLSDRLSDASKRLLALGCTYVSAEADLPPGHQR